MKKFLSILLAVLLMTAVFAVATSAMLGRTYHGEIPMLTDHRNEIRLDGVREELYANAVEIPINRWRSGATDGTGSNSFGHTVKSESELLFTEKRMNCTNTQTLTVASKQDLFQRERKYKAVSIDTEMGGSALKRWDLQQFISLLALICTLLIGSYF